MRRRCSNGRGLGWTLAAIACAAACSGSPAAPQPAPTTTTVPSSGTTPPTTTPPTTTPEACSYSLNPSSVSIIGEGGSFTFSMTRESGSCAWTATAEPWISLSASSGSGSATVTAAVALNGSPGRSGAITVSWTAGTAGPQSAKLIVNQSDVVPKLLPGTVAALPEGKGIASATVFAFRFVTQPSGGLQPYTYAWNFGDGSRGAGATPTHAYSSSGSFKVVVTVTDSHQATASVQTTVEVDVVTGAWKARVVLPNGFPNGTEPITLTQTQDAVGATVDAVSSDGTPHTASGMGSVSDPRKLTITLLFGPLLNGVVYTGTLDGLLTTWTGTVTGYSGCPCTFTAVKSF